MILAPLALGSCLTLLPPGAPLEVRIAGMVAFALLAAWSGLQWHLASKASRALLDARAGLQRHRHLIVRLASEYGTPGKLYPVSSAPVAFEKHQVFLECAQFLGATFGPGEQRSFEEASRTSAYVMHDGGGYGAFVRWLDQAAERLARGDMRLASGGSSPTTDS